MKKNKMIVLVILLMININIYAINQETKYRPSLENLRSRAQFENDRFGIFIHWGIYSVFGQGEWYMNNADINAAEYAHAASAFFPSEFNAAEWIAAIKASGARYITFTSRHHDGFSLWHTKQTPYNIVDATPFRRDILLELAQECRRQSIHLHLYYSHIDWYRHDYPSGRTGRGVGKNAQLSNYQSYFSFMNAQLQELITNYKPRAIWFDGWWDHENDNTPFSWQLEEQYSFIHQLDSSCLIGNNHHRPPFIGEDFQMFERDLPGENKSGYSEKSSISRLPLETCETMNHTWGYSIEDQDYKPAKELIHLLVRTAGHGANLLLNISPLPNGQLPDSAISRLYQIGDWMNVYASTIRNTSAGDFNATEWGTSTRRGDTLFVHILNAKEKNIFIPTKYKIIEARHYLTQKNILFTRTQGGAVIHLDSIPTEIDCVVQLKTK